MKYQNYMALIGLAALLSSCELTPKEAGLWKNEQIPAGDRTDFHELNDQFLKDIKAKEISKAENQMSKEELENSYHKRVVELIGNSLQNTDYTLMDEYYLVNRLKKLTYIKPSTAKTNLTYTPIAKEMYIAFFLPKQGANKKMITMVYGKFDYGWKIDKLEFEPYSKNGKTATQLYADAQKQYANGYLVDAINTLASAQECSLPSEELTQADYDGMRKYYAELVQQANSKYKFPLVISAVPTHPKIFRITNENIDEGTFPSIRYLSTISIKDTAAVKLENDKVKKVIGGIIPGIDKDKKYVLYSIYNKLPNSHENAYSFDIKDKL